MSNQNHSGNSSRRRIVNNSTTASKLARKLEDEINPGGDLSDPKSNPPSLGEAFSDTLPETLRKLKERIAKEMMRAEPWTDNLPGLDEITMTDTDKPNAP